MHQWLRSAIPHSQPPTSPIGFLFFETSATALCGTTGILETEPDQEFLGFMIETKPLELIYQGPTQVSQVLSPFSASPPSVLLSGFRSRCHIVIKGAFPSLRVQQGLSQLIRLYARAGFPNEELQSISNQLLIQHQNSSIADQKLASAAFSRVARFIVVPVLFFPLVSGFFLSFLVVVGVLLFLVSLLQLFGSISAFFLLRPRLNDHGSRSRASVPSSFGQSYYAS